MTHSKVEDRVNEGLLVLRLGAGIFLALAHGLPKLLTFSEKAPTFPDPLHVGSALSLTLATGAELLGGLLLAVGLLTRGAALSALFTMLVAGFIQHAGDPWNRKELALLYAVAFAAILLSGPGSLSLDAWLKRRKRPSVATTQADPQKP